MFVYTSHLLSVVHQSGAVRGLHLHDFGLQLVHAPAAGIQHASVQSHRQRLDAHIVYKTQAKRSLPPEGRKEESLTNIVCLVEHDNALGLEVSGDQVGHLRVQHVLVVVHQDAGVVNQVARQEVGAPPLGSTQLFQVVQRVHALRNLL